MIETSKGQVREMTDSGSSQVLIGRICEPKDCWAKNATFDLVTPIKSKNQIWMITYLFSKCRDDIISISKETTFVKGHIQKAPLFMSTIFSHVILGD
ncbi:hypothetical protein YC2023_094935 [Brassica napus]